MDNKSQPNALSLISYIRFQLEQLSSKNAHHEFEHLCRHLARNTITPLILPATGPVSAGGDQGRDFETFTSFISSSGSESKFFLGSGESKPIVFACSLTKKNKIQEKVLSDIREICRSISPYIIYFYSSQDIPIATRNKIIALSKQECDARLEILDAQAISELLSDNKSFWIAEEFLKIPSDLFPKILSDVSWYEEIKDKWLVRDVKPMNYADFVSIKSGLRRATFNKNVKQDLTSWINKIEDFQDFTVPDLRRRASYEICVAALRGQNNLTSKKHIVEDYFSKWLCPLEASELSDSTILLSYCSSAVLHGVFEFDVAILHSWSKNLIKHLNLLIAKTTSPNALAELLAIRSHAAHLPFANNLEGTFDFKEIFKWWNKVVIAAKNAPLFPIEDFADLITNVAPYIGDSNELNNLIRRMDTLLIERSKEYLVAEKSRDRAIEYLKANKTLRAIDELHRAKVRWFTGDTLKGTILTLFTLSEAYLKLGLSYASKYHLLGGVFLIFRSDDDEIRAYLPKAISSLANCCYVAGEWMTFSDLLPMFLIAHYQYTSEPDDWTSSDIQSIIFHWVISKSIAKSMGGAEAVTLMEQPLSSMVIPDDIKKELLNPPLSLDNYENISNDEIVEKTSNDLLGLPFTDCGPTRVYKWKALGITWIANAPNTIDNIPYVEEFVAVLQITIADFGEIDLCLLPTRVNLFLEVSQTQSITINEKLDKDFPGFNLEIPKSTQADMEQVQATQSEVLAVVNTILIWCSCLPDEEIHKKLKFAYKNELGSKAFLVRPYWELFLNVVSSKDFDKRHSSKIGTLNYYDYTPKEHTELRWNSEVGFGYSQKKAQVYLKNRYQRGILPIRHTLKKLQQSSAFQYWVLSQRKKGYLDWQILLFVTNAVINHKISLIAPKFDPVTYRELTNNFLNTEEKAGDIEFPEEVLYSEDSEFRFDSNLFSNAATWGLAIRRSTNPDFVALKQLLNHKYFQSSDDVPHEELFKIG